jgi:glutamate synthase (NADPH/NADH) large chain
MVPVDEMTVREKGALGPGQMIAVDMAEGKLYHDWDLKDRLAASQPFGEWVEKVIDLNARDGECAGEVRFSKGRAAPPPDRRRLYAGGTGAGSGADGRGRQGNGGLDGRRYAAAVLSSVYTGPLSHYLPPELQPGDQPAHRQPCAKAG